MEFYSPQLPRRHNPVDSMCRKLQAIQWRGDREPHSPFQIPKLSSSTYDSLQCGLQHNLEAILKKEGPHGQGAARERRTPTSEAPLRGSMAQSVPLSIPSTPKPANITYTITGTLGERQGADGSDARQSKSLQCCSTPTGWSKDTPFFRFTQGSQMVQSESINQSRSPPRTRTFSYNLNFCVADSGSSMASDLPYPALVVKRLSLGDGGSTLPCETKENMAEVSLICEEDLLDTIFHACDTQRRGKVYVSRIVDYLRHTTSRTTEDSGLEELCNMLDPERKDVSIDLDTYHAIMKEWIEDCRNNGNEPADDVTRDSFRLGDALSVKRSMLLNMTSGSLEAFGGEASRLEFETSELVHCVADLQLSNRKLEEEVKKLKQVVESMEDNNQKLAEENEELRNQAQVNQQLSQKQKMLKEEVEEMKATLSCTEEGRARASAHSKHVERENQSLVAKIASLQEENFKVTMETDELQKRIAELCDINADLQVQIDSFDAIISEKEVQILEKHEQIEELKAAVEEYSSVTELLRADKTKLENQMQMIHPDLAGADGLTLSVAYRLNQSDSGSLQTELALAQSPLEVHPRVDHLASTLRFASPLDETLDREVLLLLQGPSHEHATLQFKTLLSKLKKNFKEDTDSILSSVRGLLDDHTQPAGDTDKSLQTVQAQLEVRRANWTLSLDTLAQHTESMEKELIKMASNMRRSRTEILHLSVRVQEQENQKRQMYEELEQLKAPQDSREASCQMPATEDKLREDLDLDEEFALQDFLKSEQAERNCCVHEVQADSRLEDTKDKMRDSFEEDKWVTVDAGEGKDTSTPLPPDVGEDQSGQGQESAACDDTEPEVNCQPLEEEAVVPLSAHSQAVNVGHTEADVLPDPSHSENNSADLNKTSQSCPGSPSQSVSRSSEQDQTFTPGLGPQTAEMVPAERTPPGSEVAVTKSESLQPIREDCKGRGAEEKAGQAKSSPGVMNRSKRLSQDQSDSSAAEESTSLLPVLEEEGLQDGTTEAPSVTKSMAGTNQLTNSGMSSSPHSAQKTSFSHAAQSGTSKTNLLLNSKKELEFSRTVAAAAEHKVPVEQSETSTAAEKESETSVVSDTDDSFSEDRSSLSPTDKEVEEEFQHLALGFKCDMFTLEKRLRLEERSRDLAEENVRREVSSCQGLLQALIPLCEDDNQSMEIIQRLQKNLDILIQSMTRVSSRSEMLGAIHQESRIGKAVEVMIQHVENLRRMYTKEHAELLELRETLMQNERSFGSQTERDDFRGKKQSTAQYYKSTGRRVSIAAIPRGGNVHFDTDGFSAEPERLNRRSWSEYVHCHSTSRELGEEPTMARRRSSLMELGHKFVSLILPQKTSDVCRSTHGQLGEEPETPRRRSSLTELGNKLVSLVLPQKTPSASSSPSTAEPVVAHSLSQSLSTYRAAAALAQSGRGLWLWLAIVVLLAGLLALLASLVMQPTVDASPVTTRDSWVTIQQLLWPYIGLQHNGQPPV
ncbi:lymphoid-restricted membrane protein isoform X2 [Thalassophryne amazonica]|uniref:lymphoid-restricted membrane protein isoform X2 n=1 Tax=Thalassophryne amazonica TaxID=390379 RepID=UPI0014723566|nr:lymphoid-restricted membrane protein isoform X2 [Thalassophryne amazonica]